MTTDTNRPVKTVETAFKILELIQDANGIRFTTLVDELDMAKSTVHRHLGTLESNGFLVRNGKEYHIGLRFLDYGIYARNHQYGYELARAKTRELAEETNELCVFMVEEHGRGYILCREKGANAVETGTRVGKCLYLHATAGGKSILSQYTPDHVEAILDTWGLPSRTKSTITSRSEFVEEIELIRKRGYALSYEEHIIGLQTVGVPITDGTGRVVGALCISGPTNRVAGHFLEEEIPDLLLGAANEIELNLTYDR